MFYVRPNNHPYYYNAPRYSYAEPEPYVSPDELARARYLRALQEQRAARRAYADSIAERELRRLEEDIDERDTGYPFAHAQPRHAQPNSRYFRQPSPVEDEDEFEPEHGYDDWASAIRAQQLQRARAHQAAVAAEQERQRALAAAAEEQRQRALAAAAEEQRRRALAAAEEEERRKAHAYQQAKAHADAFKEQQFCLFAFAVVSTVTNVVFSQRMKPSNRKLGRVTPDTRATGPAPADGPVRIHIRGGSPVRHVPVSSAAPAPAPAPAPATEESTPAVPDKSALSAIASIESALSSLRSSFALPAPLDFAAPRELSYASQNAPIRAYEHKLAQLLEKLDEIESAGVAEIRKERKRVVELVEHALEDVDQLVKEEWKKTHPEEQEKEEDEKHEDEMEAVEVESEVVVSATTASHEETMEVEPEPEISAPATESYAPPADAESEPTTVDQPSTSPTSELVAPPADDTTNITPPSEPEQDDMDVEPSHAAHELDPIVEEPMSDAEADASTVHESVVLERPSSPPAPATAEPSTSVDAPEPTHIDQDHSLSAAPVLVESPPPAETTATEESAPTYPPQVQQTHQDRTDDFEML